MRGIYAEWPHAEFVAVFDIDGKCGRNLRPNTRRRAVESINEFAENGRRGVRRHPTNEHSRSHVICLREANIAQRKKDHGKNGRRTGASKRAAEKRCFTGGPCGTLQSFLARETALTPRFIEAHRLHLSKSQHGERCVLRSHDHDNGIILIGEVAVENIEAVGLRY